MKNKLLLLAVLVSLWSCGGGGGDDPTPTPTPTENSAPSQPSLSNPTDGKLCIDNSVNFNWSAATDEDGDAITYLLEVATNNTFTQNKQTFPSLTSTSKSVTLDKGTAYYWRVKATDSNNLSGNYSSIFDFYTEGEGVVNYLPFSPSLVSPELNSFVQTATATLEWDSSDVDNDPLTYTIYFEDVNPPTAMVSENQTGKTFTTATLTGSTTYYWKVEVSDGNGGTTIGQVWNFIAD
ncbi:hypothetical protein R3X25_14780 [Lutibacter sp. TH_r2]|uniref:hypothetical protein n=1 Tax=Lutibacter sp. TH_r2 TaxID=3082083 RepID=UPI0029549336|nr:hypothetical protein [Lutibacter sp. TH_r2]MDV7188551.1 hypothetical protein [Lutibacter sp. TH_r2]